MAARCPRQAAMGLLGYEPTPADERTQGLFRRGKDAEVYYGERLYEKYGIGEVEHQRATPWPAPPALPIGELHGDYFVKSEKMAVEVKCSTSPDSMFDSAMTQLAGEVFFDPEAEHGALVFIDPIDYHVRATYPLILTARWQETVEEIAAQVVEAGKTKELPSRTCAHPGEGRGKHCPFIEACFEGWQPPAAGDFEETALAVEFYEADRSRRAASEFGAGAEARYKAAKEALLEAGLSPGESLSGPFRIKRTVVLDSERVSLAKIRSAGVPWPDELYAPFTSYGGGHDRITVERISLDEVSLPKQDDDEAPF